MSTEAKGLFWGWLGGFVGGSLALPFLAGLLWYRGDTWGAVVSLCLYGSFIFSALFFSPWRYPQHSISRLYLIALLCLIASTAFMLWRFHALEPLPQPLRWQLLSISFTLLTPVFVLRGRCGRDYGFGVSKHKT